MEEFKSLTFPALFAETIRKNGDRPAMALVGETPITYNELNEKIQALIAWLEKLGIKQGDKIAILSSSIPGWGISYYAITFMGAIVVPLLPDFHASEIGNIIEHSEAKAIFVSDGLRSKINDSQKYILHHVFIQPRYSLVLTDTQKAHCFASSTTLVMILTFVVLGLGLV